VHAVIYIYIYYNLKKKKYFKKTSPRGMQVHCGSWGIGAHLFSLKSYIVSWKMYVLDELLFSFFFLRKNTCQCFNGEIIKRNVRNYIFIL
jgi:hypothetical protein